MRFPRFEMERWQSAWEHEVDCNLAESGIHPVTPGDYLSEQECRQLLDIRLGYPQTNGTLRLRKAISALYPGAGPANVLVTTGTSEANLVASLLTMEPGDDAVLMLPNYMQIWGLVRALGGNVQAFPLLEDRHWAPDLEQLERVTTSRTRLIAVCNPNNPTGAVLSAEEMAAIVQMAEKSGAWLLSDEVYRGAELDGTLTPSFWSLYDKVLVTCGLSKAFALPGLRVGWILAASEQIERAWSYRDYTTIAISPASDFLASQALQPEKRQVLFERNRKILKLNLAILEDWVKKHAEIFALIRPKAGAIAYLRYDLDIPSETLAERLRQEAGLLLVPGTHFQMGNFLRIGFGCESEQLRDGLGRFDRFLQGLARA
jgi:aspartate/methionine/tyrosine aminotransferase